MGKFVSSPRFAKLVAHIRRFYQFVEGVLSSLVRRDSRRTLRNAEKNSDLTSLLKNLRQRAKSLGLCLSQVELATLVWRSEPEPADTKLRVEWSEITKGFPDILHETLKLTGNAIARMEDVNDVVAFLSKPNSDPTKLVEKRLEIGVLQKEIVAEIQRTETLLGTWEALSTQLNDYRRKSSCSSKNDMTERTKQSIEDVLNNVGQLLKKDPLDHKLVEILKTTSFPGTMHSTTQLLSTEDCLQLHELLDGESGRILDPDSKEGTTVRTQLESLLNVWKILMADFNAILDATSRDIAGCYQEHYRGKIHIVLDVYATYSMCLKDFSRQRTHK